MRIVNLAFLLLQRVPSFIWSKLLLGLLSNVIIPWLEKKAKCTSNTVDDEMVKVVKDIVKELTDKEKLNQ